MWTHWSCAAWIGCSMRPGCGPSETTGCARGTSRMCARAFCLSSQTPRTSGGCSSTSLQKQFGRLVTKSSSPPTLRRRSSYRFSYSPTTRPRLASAWAERGRRTSTQTPPGSPASGARPPSSTSPEVGATTTMSSVMYASTISCRGSTTSAVVWSSTLVTSIPWGLIGERSSARAPVSPACKALSLPRTATTAVGFEESGRRLSRT
mmetsp:Transcript_122758/g.392423  ORF Transcript_122758/g.392423 Transcript_122758/m.392423 type:complete len:206 (-) Transcript_122758:201-818(-)